jgi:predicted ABC-type ATPase
VCRLLVITGSMGSGKTTVMAEASDLLTIRGVAHAAVDLDALGMAFVPDRTPLLELTYANLRAVWGHYAAAGINSLLVACAVETVDQLQRIRAAVSATDLMVCRLTAPIGTMQERIRLREPGMLQQRFVDRIALLEQALDACRVEDFSIRNDGRRVTEVAAEMLERAGWLDRQNVHDRATRR